MHIAKANQSIGRWHISVVSSQTLNYWSVVHSMIIVSLIRAADMVIALVSERQVYTLHSCRFSLAYPVHSF